MGKEIQFVNDAGQIVAMDAAKLEDMSLPAFANFEGRLHNVRRDRLYDTAIWEANTTITPAHKKSVFRKGLDEQETYATSATEYKKSMIHTNLLKNGEIEKGDLMIVKNLEIEHPFFGGYPVASTAGEISNARAVFTGTYDPALAAYAWLSQLLVQFKRGTQIICENLAINFPQDAGLYAAYGANSGAYIQNGAGANLLPNVQVIEGGDDFSVVLTPLCAAFDNLAATPGLNLQLRTKVVLDVVRLRTIYA